MIRVADYVIQFLNEKGIGHIFTVTGRGILYLTDALAKSGMESISVHHEQAAAYAAYGYAQAKNDLGACLVSTGCAATNAITGVLCAWQDGVPCIFISGQNSLQETSRYTGIPIRTYGSQEADLIPIVESITKYAVMITDPQDIACELEKAVWLAMSGRRGPVWIDIPFDVQNMRIEPELLKHFEPEQGEMPCASEEEITYTGELLEKAARPVLLVGSGVRSAGAEMVLRAFLNKYPMPVVFAPSAVDIYGAGECYGIGAVGSMGGSRAGNFAVQNSDLVLVLGHRLSSMTTGNQFEKFAREAKVLVVDLDPVEHSKKMIPIDRLILSDVKVVLQQLMDRELEVECKEWMDKCLHWKKVFPKCEDRHREKEQVDLHNLADAIGKIMDKKAKIVTDAGFEELIVPSVLELSEGQRCIHPVSQGAMGFSLSAAMGACIATGDQTISVNGDGSIMMNLQELWTIHHARIPVKVIVANNNCYAVIRKRQKDLFRTRTIGTDGSNGVCCPSFQKVADSFEIPYVRVNSSEELEEKISMVLQMEGPVICEVMCVEEQEYLHSSFTRGQAGRIVRPPLEDQSPFMDRELFLKEMLIEPIDL